MDDLHRLTNAKTSAPRLGRATPPAAKIHRREDSHGGKRVTCEDAPRARQPGSGIVFVLAAAGGGTELPPVRDHFVTRYKWCLGATVPSCSFFA